MWLDFIEYNSLYALYYVGEKNIILFAEILVSYAWYVIIKYSHRDSNPNRQNRNLKSYPLDYGSKFCPNIL